MPRYIIVNRSGASLHLMIPAPPDSWHHKFKEYTLPRGLSVDIVPYAGSVEACKKIAWIKQLSDQHLIEIIEEE